MEVKALLILHITNFYMASLHMADRHRSGLHRAGRGVAILGHKADRGPRRGHIMTGPMVGRGPDRAVASAVYLPVAILSLPLL